MKSERASSPSVAAGARYGAYVGLGLLCVGLLRLVGALVAGTAPASALAAHAPTYLGEALGYVASFTLAGAVIGAGWRLRHTALGRFAVGYLSAGVCCTGLVALVVATEPGHAPLAFYLTMDGVSTVLFGTGVTMVLRDPDEALRGAAFSALPARRKLIWTLAVLLVLALAYFELH